jgi:hypothetical protein
MTDKIARVWNGTEWVVVSSPVGVPNSIAVYQQEPPLSPVAGQLWVDSDNDETGNYFISSTVDLNNFVTQNQIDDKQKKIPYQSYPPSPEVSGDLWVDSSEFIPTLKVYDGSSWVNLGGSQFIAEDDQNVLANRMFT